MVYIIYRVSNGLNHPRWCRILQHFATIHSMIEIDHMSIMLFGASDFDGNLHVLLKAASWVWCCSWLCFGVGFSLLAHADLAVAVTGLCFRASQWEKQHGNSNSYLPQLMCNLWNVLKCHDNSQHRNGRSKVWPQHATTCQAQSHRCKDRDTAQELIVFSAVRSNRAARAPIEDRNRCEEFDAERLIWTPPDSGPLRRQEMLVSWLTGED